jgi:hypothetical protein
MWFADGAGWAYHPDLAEKIDEIIRSVTPVLNSSQSKASFSGKCPSGLLVGEKTRQEQCDDPNAVGRIPHVLRVALMSHTLCEALSTGDDADNKRLGKDICRQLDKLTTPTKRGECAALVVWASADSLGVTQSPSASELISDLDSDISQLDAFKDKNSQLKQENKKLRGQIEELKDASPIRTQRWLGIVLIILLSAMAGAAGMYFGGPYLRNEAELDRKKELPKELPK